MDKWPYNHFPCSSRYSVCAFPVRNWVTSLCRWCTLMRVRYHQGVRKNVCILPSINLPTACNLRLWKRWMTFSVKSYSYTYPGLYSSYLAWGVGGVWHKTAPKSVRQFSPSHLLTYILNLLSSQIYHTQFQCGAWSPSFNLELFCD